MHDALQLVTGCHRPTPIDNLFVLARIILTELFRKRATLYLARRAMDLEHSGLETDTFSKIASCLHQLYTTARLKLKHPFISAALELLKDIF